MSIRTRILNYIKKVDESAKPLQDFVIKHYALPEKDVDVVEKYFNKLSSKIKYLIKRY